MKPFLIFLLSALSILPLQAEEPDYAAQALEVTEYLREHFWNRRTGLYARAIDTPEPDYIWGSGVMFSALVGAATHDKRWQPAMRHYFNALEGYWDEESKIPGYEPAPTAGNGNDKYYDDNAWMVITFAEAYELTKERRYLKRSEETLDFVLSGWDDAAGGGIWWHEKHKDDGKNTCANAPAAVGALLVARLQPNTADRLIPEAERIVAWTQKTLQAPNGLYADHIKVSSGEINPDQLTYNAGLMLRANLELYRHTRKQPFLDEAIRIGKAAASLTDRETGAYRDEVKWAHLMTEADLDLYRETGDPELLERARKNAHVHYQLFKTSPPKDLLAMASIARELWLMANMKEPAAR